jgi:hypothetical protein
MGTLQEPMLFQLWQLLLLLLLWLWLLLLLCLTAMPVELM